MAACGSNANVGDSQEDADQVNIPEFVPDENMPRFVQHWSELDVLGNTVEEKKDVNIDEVIKPGVKFVDVLGIEKIKDLLKVASVPPLTCEPILLFGPPGTGKTFLASAVVEEAHEAVTCYSVSSRKVESLEKLFTKALKNSPSIVFVDDAEFLPATVAKLVAGAKNVLTIAATNRPMDMNSEVVKAFPNRYNVSLPAIDSIASMFQRLVGDVAKSLKKKDFDTVVESLGSENFSTSEVKSLIEQSVKENDVSLKSITDKMSKLKVEREKKKQDEYLKEMQEWTRKFAMD